jgi:hypothetical protein
MPELYMYLVDFTIPSTSRIQRLSNFAKSYYKVIDRQRLCSPWDYIEKCYRVCGMELTIGIICKY